VLAALNHPGIVSLLGMGTTDGTPFAVLQFVDGPSLLEELSSRSYIALEQVLGGVVRAPADVYSLGLVLLEAVTGRREYVGGVVELAFGRLLRDPEGPDTVPAPLAEVLLEMTLPEPARRPSAARVSAARWRAGSQLLRRVRRSDRDLGGPDLRSAATARAARPGLSQLGAPPRKAGASRVEVFRARCAIVSADRAGADDR